MEKSPEKQEAKKREKYLALKLIIIAFCAVVVVLVVKIMYAEYKDGQKQRAAFIERITIADSFDKLKDRALFIPREDGTWVVIHSDTGRSIGLNWTLAVDSNGKWLETNDPSHDLMMEVWVYRSSILKSEELQAALQDPTIDTETRTLYQDWMKSKEEDRRKYFPYRIAHAATLAEVRDILHAKGFRDAPELPLPRMTGTTTRPATTIPTPPSVTSVTPPPKPSD